MVNHIITTLNLNCFHKSRQPVLYCLVFVYAGYWIFVCCGGRMCTIKCCLRLFQPRKETEYKNALTFINGNGFLIFPLILSSFCRPSYAYSLIMCGSQKIV